MIFNPDSASAEKSPQGLGGVQLRIREEDDAGAAARPQVGFDWLKRFLSWITCARRPLKVPELRRILAFDVRDTELNQEDLPEAQDAGSVCAG